MRRWLAREGAAFDVINTHSSTDAWLVALACATLRRMPPVVRTRHVSTPVNNSLTTRWLYTRATAHLVVTGEALKAQLVRDNGYDPARITSVRTGIDLARFRPQDRDAARARLAVDARPAVAIVATLRDWKGHDDLLDAWLLLRARVPGWQLLVIGDGPRRAHLEGRVAALGLAQDVRFTGNQDDVPAWFACAEITTLPSYGDEGRAAEPDAGGRVRAARGDDADRRDSRGGRRRRDGAAGAAALAARAGCRAGAADDRRGAARADGRRRARVRAGQLRHRPHARRDGRRVRARGGRAPLMCGIGGHFGRPRGPELRARMMSALASRGPDAQHVAAFDADGARLADDAPAAAGLVHARLSIIDPRPVADQPMGNDDGSIWICYNGEVYGWAEAARELAARGAAFRTHSDTEFILRGYEAWGIEGLLPRLRGMFAFALVDFRARRVHVVRDRMGLKPIVYAQRDGTFAFGSTVRSVLPSLPAADRGFSAASIDAYLAHRYVPAPRTIFTHIARLPNAHRLEYAMDGGTLDVRRYWSPQPSAVTDCGALLDEAIELRLVADRPLGLFLSGGVDSGTIACRLAATGHRGLRSFSAAFPGSSFDESAEAAATAAALGLPNERIDVPTTIAGDFARIVAALDEPFADPSSFPTWYLARATERHVKVVLGGDGGDELFAGYKRIAKHLRNAWRGGLRVPLPLLPDARPKGWRKAMGELALDWESAYALRFSGLTPNQRHFLQPGRGGAAAALLARARSRRPRRGTTGCCAGTSRTTCPSTCCARPTSRRWRTGWSCARRSSTTGSSRRCSRCRPRSGSRRRRRSSWRPSRPTSSGSGPSRARSAASIRRSGAGSRTTCASACRRPRRRLRA